MDATDRELAEQMVAMHERTLDFLLATPDTPYGEIAYCLSRIAHWSRRLHDCTFGQIRGASR